jgi:hypothetical protein
MLTDIEPELLVIVPDGASEEDWQDGRSEGPTASVIRAIANGSRKRWRSVLDDMLNGSTFHGNEHTRRGHDREGAILAAAAQLEGVLFLHPSGALFGCPTAPLHRATPDGLGLHQVLGYFGAEVKHHAAGWTRETIPADHMDQMQWGMHVTGYAWWLYAWAVDGEEDIHHEWVPRDDTRIEQLARQADAFIEWRQAGAPEIDDIPDDVDDALADYRRGLELERDGAALKKAARPVIDAWATERSTAGDPLRRNGSRAAVFFEPKPDVEVLDEVAWAAAEPESYAEWLALQQRVLDAASAARLLYSKTKPAAATFRVTPTGAPA